MTPSSLCSLLREISKIKPRNTTSRQTHGTRNSYPALDIFNRWLEALRKNYSPLPPGTITVCFRLLFPEEDTKRKYEIKETRLARHLSEALGLSRNSLENWDSDDASGCLGLEIMRLLQPKFAVNAHT
jgi:DNA ligase-4